VKEDLAAAVFIIEYFKFDPNVTLLILQFSLPVLVGISVARLISIMWHGVFQYVVVVALAILLAPILLALRFFRYSLLEKLFGLFEGYERRQKAKIKKERKFFISNVVIACSLIFALYFGQSYENFIGKAWNPKFNKDLLHISNLHYYCQVTGSYNQLECSDWLKKRDDYISTATQSNSEKKKLMPNKKMKADD